MLSKTNAVSVYLTDEEKEWLENKAIEQDRSMAYILRALIREKCDSERPISTKAIEKPH